MIRTCSSCGTKNRVPAARLADSGRCGACKAPLPPASEPIDADEALFDEIVREARVPVLVDFWAPWCAPCRFTAPEVQELARQMAGRALVLKVNTEAHPELAARYQIQAIPNFIVFRGGQPVSQHAGAVSRTEMQGWLEEAGASTG